MTVIAALVHDDVVYVATDTIATDGRQRRWHGVRKTHRMQVGLASEALIAAAGPLTLSTTWERLASNASPDTDDLADCDQWAQTLAVAYTETVAERVPPPSSEDLDQSEAVLAFAGRLWTIEAHLALPVEGAYTAIGGGGDYALGALEVAHPLVVAGTIAPAQAVAAAVRAAIKHCASCGGDVDVQTLAPGELMAPPRH